MLVLELCASGLSASVQREDNLCRQCHRVRESMIMVLELNRNKNFKFYHFRLGIGTKVDVMVEHFSSWKRAQNIFRHSVTFVVLKVCDVLKAVTLVGGVTFVHPSLRRLLHLRRLWV